MEEQEGQSAREANRADLGAWLARRLGHTLVRAVAALHSHEEVVDYDDPIAMTLHFDDMEPGRLHLGPDGFTMRVDSESSFPFDMGECGHVLVEDVTSREPWQSLRGKPLLRAGTLWESDEEFEPSGMWLGIEGAEDVFLVNWGDEFQIWEPKTFAVLGQAQFDLVPAEPTKRRDT